jgi:hypothetical protein
MIATTIANRANTPSHRSMNRVSINATCSTGEDFSRALDSSDPPHAALFSAAFWHFGQTPQISSV